MRTLRGGRHARPLVDLGRLRIIWIAIAFWPARVAGRKGHSFIGYFIFSLFFFPAAIIVAYLVHDRTQVPGRATTLSASTEPSSSADVVEQASPRWEGEVTRVRYQRGRGPGVRK